MTWLGVPILDWVILAGLLVLGVEAWVTTRPSTPHQQPDGQPPELSETPSAENSKSATDA